MDISEHVPAAAPEVEARLSDAELVAVATAEPTPYADEVLKVAAAHGRHGGTPDANRRCTWDEA